VVKTLKVVAKNERPETIRDLNEEEAKFAELYQNCWHPKVEERPSMQEIVNILVSIQ
jgi:hypothetical protein